MRYLVFLLLSFAVCSAQAQVQDSPFTDSLKNNLAQATSPYNKVYWLGELAMFYTPLDKKISDDYARQQQQVAEESRSRELIIMALLYNTRRFSNFNSVENLKTANDYATRALKIAQENRLEEWQARAYIGLAYGARENAEYDKALNYNNLALSLATTSDNDSLKNIAYLSIGTTYLRKDDKMLAFRNYLQALNIAESSKSGAVYPMLRDTYYRIASFYRELGEREKAKDYVFKVIKLTYKYNKRMERLTGYNTLGSLYGEDKQLDMAESFYEKSLALADTLKFELIKLNTYAAMVSLYLGNREANKTLDLFKRKPELLKFIRNAGFDHTIQQAYALSYTVNGKYDSALYYFRLAEPAIEQRATRGNKFSFYEGFATLYQKMNNTQAALSYWKKAEDIARSTGDLEERKIVALNLDSVYQMLGDFKHAYHYNRQYQHYTDSLNALSTEKDVMLMEVDNENRRREREALKTEEETRTRHNIQYMGITVSIVVVFIILITLGIFRVSPATIRALGFFAFILLFEFIILLADNKIHHWTHGEPWKVLAIKIGLISILLPLHHFVEEKVVHYLLSKKMLTLSKRQILDRFTSRKDVEEVPESH